MIESVVVKAIEAVPGLNAKVYTLFAAEKTKLPLVVYVSSGTTEDDSLGGWIGSYETRMEINVLHQSYKAMKELSEKVADAIKGMKEATVYVDEDQPEQFYPEVNAYTKAINIRLSY